MTLSLQRTLVVVRQAAFDIPLADAALVLPLRLLLPAVCAPGYGGASASDCAAGATTTTAKLCKGGYYGSASRTGSDTACAACPTGRRFTYSYTSDDVYMPGATSRYGANSVDDCIAGKCIQLQSGGLLAAALLVPQMRVCHTVSAAAVWRTACSSIERNILSECVPQPCGLCYLTGSCCPVLCCTQTSPRPWTVPATCPRLVVPRTPLSLVLSACVDAWTPAALSPPALPLHLRTLMPPPTLRRPSTCGSLPSQPQMLARKWMLGAGTAACSLGCTSCVFCDFGSMPDATGQPAPLHCRELHVYVHVTR
jgi:hypothetical protein